ncbi:hypothetical protein QBC44DRAFT_377723 [Cladorrhinum sp. PSN332]|nr:hypothetical protein QBC44DRAFT_377723 [Cladorrhinum sp. PSN332]
MAGPDEEAGRDTNTETLNLGDPEKWIWDNYGKGLVKTIKPFFSSDGGDREPTSYRISLAKVQRVHLLRLRVKLVKRVADWNGSGGQHKPGDTQGDLHRDWEDDLHRYGTLLNREILNTAFNGLKSGVVNENLDDQIPVWTWEKEGARFGPIVPSRTHNGLRQFLKRVTVSLIGAGFLIGQMWLMMLEKDLNVALGSTAAFVVIFGVMMASVLDEHIHVLSSTAAYAAVLVVFVGLRGEGNLGTEP